MTDLRSETTVVDEVLTAEPVRGGGAGITLRNLTKRFAGVVDASVDAIDLDIAPGEFMTFLGPSGSGKTTTLNMIAGFTTPTEGDIRIGDTDVFDAPPYKRDLGMVFQQYALFPHMTAAQNVAFPLQQRKISKSEIKRRVHEALELVELGSFGDRHPGKLSGGQQQRVAVARAVVFNPRALLMDEPLGALDKRLREQLQVQIARIHRNLGITFVYVTHDQEEALALSDRIAVFNHGSIEQVGRAEDLYERPATQFVAEFLGDSTVFPGPVTSTGIETSLGLLRVVDDSIPIGDDAALVIRPEQLGITVDIADVPLGHNTLDATVSEVVYLGPALKFILTFDNGQSGMVRVPSRAVNGIALGARVIVHWNPSDGILVRSSK